MRPLPRPLLVVALLVAGALLQGPAPRPIMTREAAALLQDGAHWADSLVRATRAEADARAIGAAQAVAIGYLERQRLALGSPMRLVDLALHDTRMSEPVRRRLAWALLERTRLGEGGRADARALEDESGKGLSAGGAAAHLALIDRTVERTTDPRVGEQAVRLAYAMAGAEGTVPSSVLTRVLRVAALARDRELAKGDVERLLRSAQRMEIDPLALVSIWRRERWFAVERPPAADGLGLDREPIERGALALVGSLLDSVRATAAIVEPSPTPAPAGTPLLGRGAAMRLAELSAQAAPPQAPIIVALRTEQATLLEREPTASFARRARNEETLAAARAILADAGNAEPAVARVVLDAAVGMRAFAQEAVVRASDRAPSARALAAELGLVAIEFEPSIPRHWRPYYLRMLASAVTDLRRVLPDLSLDGLQVRFASESPSGSALAIHEPRSRTVVFPIETSAGTIAHELAHDLDWQAARAIYRRRGTYSTDVAIDRSDGRLAESLRGLTAARLIPPGAENGYRPPHQQRPAEVFARNVDWFVAVALAREGRSNGYLSAVQDEALTGYASVLPREVGGRGGAALMDALEQMVYVSDETRDWFLEHWGATRARRPIGIVRQTLASSPRRPGSATPAFGRSAPSALVGIDEPLRASIALCTDHPAARPGTPASLAWLAAESRARGIVRARAAWYAQDRRPAWASAVLGLAPWSPELAQDAVRHVRAQLLSQLSGSSELSGPFEIRELPNAPLGCS